ncbi:MAG TPA: hypothetical protein VKA00_04180 [Trueperaceae bacterium]|nr:hypothetical protein [Trueperaceae bacterium]
MTRFAIPVLLALAVVGGSARAATPIPYNTPRGVMVVQALHTLGAWVVACSALPGNLTDAAGEVLCAQVPGPMYGFFREAVHGRLYEYLQRKTLRVVHDWSGAGGNLSVAYAVDGGTLSIERERANGVIYAVFQFQPAARAAASGGASPRGEYSGSAPAVTPSGAAASATGNAP